MRQIARNTMFVLVGLFVALWALSLTEMPDPTPVQRADTARARTLAGCWTTKVGKFKGRPVDAGMTDVPKLVKLDTLPGIDSYNEHRDWLVHGFNQPTYVDGLFVLMPRGSVLISWSTGFTSLEISAKVFDDRMLGTAEAATDYGGMMRAAIVLVKAPCPE